MSHVFGKEDYPGIGRRTFLAGAFAALFPVAANAAENKPQYKESAMHTHLTAPTQFIEKQGVKYAYRRFGAESGVPLIFLQHFRGGMDNWDPEVTDGFAKQRPVILFDNAGVGSSGGEPADTIEAMADHVGAFTEALSLSPVDVLGFSIGGYVAQEFALRHVQKVRRLVLAGTGPRGGEPGKEPRVPQVAGNPVPTMEDFLFLFFSPSERSQAAGREFWARRHLRTNDVDPPSSLAAAKAQSMAFREYQKPKDDKFAELSKIKVPVLIVNGSNDIMIPTINSFLLFQHLPNAQLILYPDSGHGALFQYHSAFVQGANLFLDN